MYLQFLSHYIIFANTLSIIVIFIMVFFFFFAIILNFIKKKETHNIRSRHKQNTTAQVKNQEINSTNKL